MLLLVGLGNPGAKHARQRHNIGFMAVDAIAHAHGFGPEKQKFHGLIREGGINTSQGPKKALILKPQTFMNNSGVSVLEVVTFYKIAPANIVVFHDELDLGPGRYRIKVGGGHAGHNGLRSIMAHMSADFLRARMGIGHPGTKEKVLSWVLGDYSAAETGPVADLCESVARAADLLAAGDIEGHQTKVMMLSPVSGWPILPGIAASGGQKNRPTDA